MRSNLPFQTLRGFQAEMPGIQVDDNHDRWRPPQCYKTMNAAATGVTVSFARYSIFGKTVKFSCNRTL